MLVDQSRNEETISRVQNASNSSPHSIVITGQKLHRKGHLHGANPGRVGDHILGPRGSLSL